MTGPNGSGKTTLLRLVSGLAAPTGGELTVDVERAQLGYLAHEPLVYRELTALENLDLYGRLYRVPERASGSGCCSSASASGTRDTNASPPTRAGCSSGSRSAAHCSTSPTLLLLDEPFIALDAEGAELLDRELAERRGGRTFLVATHDPDRLAPLATGRARAA